MKIRRSQCRLSFNMEILILVRQYLYIEMISGIAFPMLWGIHSTNHLHHSYVVAFVWGVVWIQAPLWYLIRTVQYLPLRFFLCIIISCVQFNLFWTSNPICRQTSWSSLVRFLACCLCGTKTLQLDSTQLTPVSRLSKCNTFLDEKPSENAVWNILFHCLKFASHAMYVACANWWHCSLQWKCH